jgi:hypothetical protein
MNDLLLEMTIRALGGDGKPSGNGIGVPNRPKESDMPKESNRPKEQTAPRVTLEDIEKAILGEYYFTAWDAAECAFDAKRVVHLLHDWDFEKEKEPAKGAKEALSLLTFCVLLLKNGFTVTGESACVSTENFDAELGRRIAREHAIEKLWPLMGYALAEKLRGS